MIPSQFDYHRPKTLRKAVSLLNEHEGGVFASHGHEARVEMIAQGAQAVVIGANVGLVVSDGAFHETRVDLPVLDGAI